jgi:replicative DNA helicase
VGRTVAGVREPIDAEYATVGALLLAPGELQQVAEWLRPGDFTQAVCGEVYDLVVRMTGNGQPVDPVTVLAELRRQGRLRSDGYPTMELVRMVEEVPTPLSVGYYGRLVLEAAVFRRVEQAGTRLVQSGSSRRGEVDDVFRLIRDECRELLEVRRRYESAGSPAPPGGRAPDATLVRSSLLPDAAARGARLR